MNKANQYPLVSVIIPSYNDNARLKICLDVLTNQTYPSDRIEIIVVDNGSDDVPYDIVERYDNVSLLEEERSGSYAARNTGIHAAKGDILAFIDSDCIPQSTWIEKGVAHLQEATVPTALGGEVDVFFQHNENPSPIELYESLFAFPIAKNISDKHYPPTGNLFVRSELMHEVGLFNADLKSGGDFEWGNRAYNHGVKLLYSNEITVLHPARSTYAQYKNKTQRIAGGQVQRASDSSKPIFLNRLFYYDFLPPIGSTRTLWTAKGYTLKQKLMIFWVLLWIRSVAIREKLSLVMGLKETVR